MQFELYFIIIIACTWRYMENNNLYEFVWCITEQFSINKGKVILNLCLPDL